MNNPMIKWGAYLGAAQILFAILSYVVNKDWLMGSAVGLLISGVVTIVFLVMAMKEEKSNNEGYLSFGEGLKTGMGAYILGTLISALFMWILFNFIDPSLIEFSKEYTIETVRKTTEMMGEMFNAPEEAMEEAVAKTEEQLTNMGNPMSLSSVLTSWLIGLLIPGLILNLIISAIMKKS